jgi:hypothetical protein
LTEGEVRYPPNPLIIEAASLFYLVGGVAAKHFVIVGGLVPPLLVPDAAETHIGSADIDFCLSLAITEGKTRQYYKSIQEKIEPYFEPEGASGFRWSKKPDAPGLPLLIDFLAPSDPDTTSLADGTIELEPDVAEGNAGPQLRPFPIRTGQLIDRDAVNSRLDGIAFVYREGMRTDVEIRHAGPVGFLAAKADALEHRNDTKDGYDVAWWCLNAASTATEVAELVSMRDAFSDPLFQESVAQLRTAFKAPDYPGPDGYARERHPQLSPGDHEFETARNTAYVAVSEILDVVTPRLWECMGT